MKQSLFIIGTPLGNSLDISLRALEALSKIKVLFCEDTRSAKRLCVKLEQYNKNIHANDKTYISFYREVEYRRINSIINFLNKGISVGVLVESGMPAVADPGSAVVGAVRREGYNIVVVPGPSALTTAVSMSGFDSTSLVFLGFAPKQKKHILKIVNNVLNSQIARPLSIILFESSLRMRSTALLLKRNFNMLQFFIMRNATKTDEMFWSGKCADIDDQAFPNNGEYTIVLRFGR